MSSNLSVSPMFASSFSADDELQEIMQLFESIKTSCDGVEKLIVQLRKRLSARKPSSSPVAAKNAGVKRPLSVSIPQFSEEECMRPKSSYHKQDEVMQDHLQMNVEPVDLPSSINKAAFEVITSSAIDDATAQRVADVLIKQDLAINNRMNEEPSPTIPMNKLMTLLSNSEYNWLPILSETLKVQFNLDYLAIIAFLQRTKGCIAGGFPLYCLQKWTETFDGDLDIFLPNAPQYDVIRFNDCVEKFHMLLLDSGFKVGVVRTEISFDNADFVKQYVKPGNPSKQQLEAYNSAAIKKVVTYVRMIGNKIVATLQLILLRTEHITSFVRSFDLSCCQTMIRARPVSAEQPRGADYSFWMSTRFIYKELTVNKVAILLKPAMLDNDIRFASRVVKYYKRGFIPVSSEWYHLNNSLVTFASKPTDKLAKLCMFDIPVLQPRELLWLNVGDFSNCWGQISSDPLRLKYGRNDVLKVLGEAMNQIVAAQEAKMLDADVKQQAKNVIERILQAVVDQHKDENTNVHYGMRKLMIEPLMKLSSENGRFLLLTMQKIEADLRKSKQLTIFPVFQHDFEVFRSNGYSRDNLNVVTKLIDSHNRDHTINVW